MHKKVLVFSSSPRKGGNSDVLCDQFVRGAQEAGHQAEKVFLKDFNVRYCQGCGACSERGLPCPQKDDAAALIQKMVEADVIVMATPVYFYTMSAQMKTLIDRTCARYTQIQKKDFYFIVTAADDSIPDMGPTLSGFRAFLSCLTDAKEKGVVYGVGAWRTGEIQKTPAMQQAYEMGRNV